MKFIIVLILIFAAMVIESNDDDMIYIEPHPTKKHFKIVNKYNQTIYCKTIIDGHIEQFYVAKRSKTAWIVVKVTGHWWCFEPKFTI